VKTLLAAKADVNAKTPAGETPRALAQTKQQTAMVEFLRAHGGQ